MTIFYLPHHTLSSLAASASESCRYRLQPYRAAIGHGAREPLSYLLETGEGGQRDKAPTHLAIWRGPRRRRRGKKERERGRGRALSNIAVLGRLLPPPPTQSATFLQHQNKPAGSVTCGCLSLQFIRGLLWNRRTVLDRDRQERKAKTP